MTDKHNNGPSESPGILGQMSRLKANSSATATELRQFVRELRGRTPQEVIGTLAQSNLLRATVQATVGTVILMLLFTILPSFAGNAPAPAAAKPEPAVTTPAKPAVADAKTTDKDSSAKATTDDKKKNPAGKDALEKLGIGETKTSDPKKNPLDNAADDLFKGIK